MTPAIRPATAADWPAIEALLVAAHLPLDGAAQHAPDFLVAEQAGAIVGTIGMERYPDGALLRSAAVAEGVRGQGVGEALVHALTERARTSGVPALFLLTETAEQWFPRFGFARITRDDVPATVKQSVEFTTACPASAAVMRRALS